MSNPDTIEQYIAELAECLPDAPYSSQRILCEVEDHLRERTSQLHAAGNSWQDAEREAIARFGTAAQFTSQLDLQSLLPNEEEIMIRRSLTALVAITSLYAALFVIFALVNDPTAAFTYVKVAIAAVVIGCGVFVVRWQWMASPLSEFERFAIFCGGLALIEIGTANIVWTAHLGLASGDWEYYGFVGGILISLLGAVVAIWLAFPDIFQTKHDSQLTHVAR